MTNKQLDFGAALRKASREQLEECIEKIIFSNVNILRQIPDNLNALPDERAKALLTIQEIVILHLTHLLPIFKLDESMNNLVKVIENHLSQLDKSNLD